MNAKKQTSASVKREIEKTQKRLESCKKAQNDGKKEIADLKKHIKELEKLHDTLYREELQDKIVTALFKDDKMTDAQILKILELNKGIRDKIDILDTDKAIKAIIDACGGDSEKEKVIINDTFSDDEDETDKNEKEKVEKGS